MPNTVIIREMQNKTMRSHLILVRMIIKRNTSNKCSWRYGKKGTSYTGAATVKTEISQKTKNRTII